ncbi:MAG: 4Fe-4S binding protein, partial [Muribaculaceae bacterium]|nr:4Fe-4S binding protein [Muribaculaceae bacterium]
MEKTCEYDICTGCGICSTVCPKKCISFRTGDFGHIYPHIDTEACIDCNRCRQVCPSINDNERHYPEVAYAAFMKNEEEYQSSTSGGAAQALSLHTLRAGGVVYGCATLPGCKVEHIRVDNEEQLKLLKGSKYVQSHAWPCYNQLKTDIKFGKPVLFIGTPC